MKIERLDHPDLPGRAVYWCSSGGRTIELWQLPEGTFTVRELADPSAPLSTQGNAGDTMHTSFRDAVPLCTAQLMALKILGVEPERSVPHSGSEGDREVAL